MDASGQVLTPVDAEAVADLAKRLRGQADIVAVCFLHSYANPSHEQEVAGLLRENGVRVCTSHEVLPEYREFERWSTTVVNAYVTPLIDKYLGRLESALTGARGAPPPRTNVAAPAAAAPSESASRGAAARGGGAPRALVNVRLSIMQSNGGTISSAAARAQAVRTVLSGPAAGVVGGSPSVKGLDLQLSVNAEGRHAATDLENVGPAASRPCSDLYEGR